MKAKILEIFSSVQGEGKYAGVRQVFVRFFECNMHCTWCDTPYSIGPKAMRKDVAKKFPQGSLERYEELSIDEIFDRIQKFDAIHSVSLTGGEPLLQEEAIKALAQKLRLHGIKVHLETNGTLPEHLRAIVDSIDTIAMDIKLPSSTKTKSYWKEHAEFLNIAATKDVFIKAVVTGDTKKEDIVKAAEIVASVDPDMLFILQPDTFGISNGAVKQCLAFQEVCSGTLSNVRVMPQMHKFLKLR